MAYKRSDINNLDLLRCLVSVEDGNHPCVEERAMGWAGDWFHGGSIPEKVMLAKLRQLDKLGLWESSNSHYGWVSPKGRELVGKNTKISWCDHTWNPWRGCAKVSEGCAHCYAEQGAKRFPRVMGVWGTKDQGGTRPAASNKTMGDLARWNEESLHARTQLFSGSDHVGPKPRVFVGSVMDFFEDNPDVADLRQRVWALLHACNSLTHMLLTKRPENIKGMLPSDFSTPVSVNGETLPFPLQRAHWRHVWIGTTVENQARADERIPILLDLPRGGIRWLSLEPLLEEVDITKYLATGQISWVVVGGESMQGGRCRQFNTEWAESVVVQCDEYKVPVFVKQMGSTPISTVAGDGMIPITLMSRAGSDPTEWPGWLQRQEHPSDPV